MFEHHPNHEADLARTGAELVAQCLRDAGYEAYFVGGCVRDLLMGNPPHDYDIATDARPGEIVELFNRTVTVGAAFGVVKVLMPQGEYEVATYRTDIGTADGRHPEAVAFATAEEDASRRDFTINGLFYDPFNHKVLDWVGGQEDIHAGRIRTIGDPFERFAEDHLRLLRAVRFTARFDFELGSRTADAIRQHAGDIATVSAERIREEFVRMLTGPHRGRALRLTHELGLLPHFLPEVEAMAGCEQPPRFHPEGDVFEHTVLALEHLGDTPSPTLAMGTLLHDVGKPPTAKVDENGRVRFNQHADVGTEMTEAICRRLRFSNDATEQITSLVRNHMRFIDLKRMREATLRRLLRMNRFDEHLALHRADCLASHGKLDNYEFALEKQATLSEEAIRPPRLVTGHDLMRMGMAPGPRLGQILDALEDAQLEGEVTDRDAALGLARRLIDGGPPTVDTP
jgi:poly(A) polymerase